MYPITLKIPPVGETTTKQGIEGEDVQCVSLDFPNAHDPESNPTLVLDYGSVEVPLVIGNPLGVPFQSLAIRNDGNANAAGTLCQFWVYEGNVTPVPYDSRSGGGQSTTRVVVQGRDVDLSESEGSATGDFSETSPATILASSNRARRLYVLRVTLDASSLSSGDTSRLLVETGSGVVIDQQEVQIPSQETVHFSLARGLIVPAGQEVAFNWEWDGATADESNISYNVTGSALVDNASASPPSVS